MIMKLNIKDNDIAEQIVKLQQEAYVIEAELIDFDDIPPLKDTLKDIKESDETFIGFYIAYELAGIIAYKQEEDTLDICRVAVLPKYFRKGIARQLIHFVENNNNAKKVIVSTGMLNTPAVELYLSLDFNKISDIKICEGLYITSFEKFKYNCKRFKA